MKKLSENETIEILDLFRDYKFEKERFRDNRNISLFLRYTFNNKKKYKGKNAASEEIGRM